MNTRPRAEVNMSSGSSVGVVGEVGRRIRDDNIVGREGGKGVVRR